MENKTNEDLKEMKEIERRINVIGKLDANEVKIKDFYEYRYKFHLAKEIAKRNEFEGGCGKNFNWARKNFHRCGTRTPQNYQFISSECQAKKEIQEIWERIK